MTTNIRAPEIVRDTALGAALRRALQRPSGLRLVLETECSASEPDPREVRRSASLRALAEIYGETV